MPASEAIETEYETTFAQDSSFSVREVPAVADHQSSEAESHGAGSYHEEHEPTASDEDSDSDDTDTSRRRGRFRTERDTADTAMSLPTPVNKAEKRDIPDTLGETALVKCATVVYLRLRILIFSQQHLNSVLITVCVLFDN